MGYILLLIALIVPCASKLQNITITINSVTCDGEEFMGDLKIQVWDKDYLKDDFLGEKIFDLKNPAENITLYAEENEFFTLSPYLIFKHNCGKNCTLSTLSIPEGHVGGSYHLEKIELLNNSTTAFSKTEACT